MTVKEIVKEIEPSSSEERAAAIVQCGNDMHGGRLLGMCFPCMAEFGLDEAQQKRLRGHAAHHVHHVKKPQEP